jgi:adenosylhomocysteinase
VRITGCNPLSTQDDVAAALAEAGVEVFAWHAATPEEYRAHLIEALSFSPNLILDDGGDLTHILCEERPDLAKNLIGGGEETTTGVMRLRARAAAGTLGFPMFCVNAAKMKYLFDNRYGTGQAVWDGILRTTNLVVASKTVVVAGYGWCGKGRGAPGQGAGRAGGGVRGGPDPRGGGRHGRLRCDAHGRGRPNRRPVSSPLPAAGT